MKKVFILLLAAIALTACRPDAVVPATSTPTDEVLSIYPDYTDVVVPANIAPLNFRPETEGDEFVARYATADGKNEVIAAALKDQPLQFDTADWHTFTAAARGQEVSLTLYAQRGGTWYRHPEAHLTVAAEDIDPYLTYRLIEPSYETYRQLGIYQRNLTNFDETPIYENDGDFDINHSHCINCHTAQAYGATKRALFHVRAAHGGTVFIHENEAERMTMTTDSTLGNAVYPAWHPTENWVVFSSNRTGQVFHMADKDKIEVVDYASDLIFYDVENKTVSNVLKTPVEMETFPTWSADGRRIYYCSAYLPSLGQVPADLEPDALKTALIDTLINNHRDLRYNLMTLDFDPATRTFGEPRLVLDCKSMGKSAAVPRVSPDGRWLLVTLSDYGQFHIWHSSSDLYLLDLEAENPAATLRPLETANSDNVDSFHNWSSNGRWAVFSSRRDDGNFSRPYITYIDAEGKDHKAFLLPQEDPEQNLMRMRSYNVPELSRTPISITPGELKDVIYNDAKAGTVTYK